MVDENCNVFAIQVLFVQTFAVSFVKIQAHTHLFVKVHTYLDEETAKKTFWSSELSCHLLLPF